MQNVAILYISKLKDIDLYGLLNDIGMVNFNKCARYCIMSIMDSSYVSKARELARNKVENGAESYQKHIAASYSPERAGVKLRISLTSKKSSLVKTILSEIRSGFISQFIKTTMRQVLGPQVLMKYFLIDDSTIKIEDVPIFTSMINLGSVQFVEVKKKEKTVRKKRTVKKKEEAPSLLSTAPVLEATDAPSFGSAPTFTEAGIENKEDMINTGSSSSDDDLLSMLEAMMS